MPVSVSRIAGTGTGAGASLLRCAVPVVPCRSTGARGAGAGGVPMGGHSLPVTGTGAGAGGIGHAVPVGA